MGSVSCGRGVKGWRLAGCTRSSLSVTSAEPRDSLEYCTTLVAQQIVPFVEKVGFLISGNCYVISQKEEQNIPPLPSPPPLSAPSLFCLGYF